MADELNRILAEFEQKMTATLEAAMAKAAKHKQWLAAAAVIGALCGFGLGLLVGSLVW